MEGFIGTEIYLTKEKKDFFNKEIKITKKQEAAIEKWLGHIRDGTLKFKEEKNYPRFQNTILRDLLGYPELEIEEGFEEQYVEFSFKDIRGDTSVCIEAKPTKTDLFAIQSRKNPKHRTPIDQTFDDMSRFPTETGICTNYNDFVLLNSEHPSEFIKFKFSEFENNPQKIKEFLGIFSYDRIVVKKSYQDVRKSCITEEHDFSLEFYKLFHETRLMLIKGFREKPHVTMDDAIHFAQTFLNRLIFIFFLQDRGYLQDRLFSIRIQKILDGDSCIESSKSVSDNIISLFSSLKVGDDPQIFAYGGNLFEEEIPPHVYFYDLRDPHYFDDVKQNSKFSVYLDDLSSKIIKKYNGHVNPIITNLLIMDAFNFTDKKWGDVKILGNIFEQSISHLEELRGEDIEISKQKIDGVYYTPETYTKYICTNTIIPYLSKSNVTNAFDLIMEHQDNIQELEGKLKKIKILDPACGSGAFLVKTIDVLLAISREIQYFKKTQGTYSFTKMTKKSGSVEQSNLESWNEEAEMKKIIENNIYGIDINAESVEITKLSLFLKVAEKNRKLSTRSKNIQVGNSIIHDPKVDAKAFDWKKEFDDIVSEGGFDIIVGNPPYVRQERIKKFKDYLENNYESFAGKADLYVYFYEKAVKLLKSDGYLAYISSSKFFEAQYGKKLEEYLFSNTQIKEIIHFGDLEVFKKIDAYPQIFIATKHIPLDYYFKFYKIDKLDYDELSLKLQNITLNEIQFKDFKKYDYKFVTKKMVGILEKIFKDSKSLEQTYGLPLVGIKTGYNKAYFSNSTKGELIKPLVLGKNIKKYSPLIPTTQVIFPYISENNSYNLVNLSDYPEFEKILQFHKEKLEERAIIKPGIEKGNKIWYEYQQINQNIDFDKEFIVNPDVSLGNNFSLSSGNIIDMTGFVIPSNDKYLLALLNSLIVHFIINIWSSSIKGGYRRYKSQYLEKIPIKITDVKKQKIIIKYVDDVMELKKKSQKIEEKLMNRIISDFSPEKISENIDNMFDLSFIEIYQEMKKVSKKRLSHDEQDDWEDYFNSRKKIFFDIENEVNKIYKKLDSLFYEIYDLDNKEIRILENYLRQ